MKRTCTAFAAVGVLAGLALLGAGARPAQALAGPQFSLQPVSFDPAVPQTRSYFVFDAQPDRTFHSRVRVLNTGTAAGTVQLYPVDAGTGQTSGTIFLSRHDPRRQAGAWISVEREQLTLEPGSNQVVGFTVRVPADARSGQHVGGLVAEAAVPTEAPVGPSTDPNTAGFRVRIQSRTALAVQVNLPGPAVERLEVTGVQPAGQQGYQTLLLGLRNSGTVMLRPSGVVQVTNERGQRVQERTLALDTVLPGSEIRYPLLIEGQALAAGSYQASIALDYGAGHTARHHAAFTITPAHLAQVFTAPSPLAPPAAPPSVGSGQAVAGGRWAQVLGSLLLVMLVGGYAFRRRRTAVPPGPPLATAKPQKHGAQGRDAADRAA